MALPQPDTPYLSNEQVLIAESKLAKLNANVKPVQLRRTLASFYNSLAVTPLDEHSDTNVPLIIQLDKDGTDQEYFFYAKAFARTATKDSTLFQPLFLADVFSLAEQIKEKLKGEYAEVPEFVSFINGLQPLIRESVLSIDGETYYQEDKLYDHREQLREQVWLLARALDKVDAGLATQPLAEPGSEESGKSGNGVSLSGAGSASSQQGNAGQIGPERDGNATQAELIKDEPFIPQEEKIIGNQRLEAARLTSSLLLIYRNQFQELYGITYENAEQAPLELRNLMASRLMTLVTEEDWARLETDADYRLSLLGQLRQKVLSDSTFWAQAATYAVQHNTIQPGKPQQFLTTPLKEAQTQLKIEPRELLAIQETIDAFIVAGVSPAILNVDSLSPQEFQAIFNLTRTVSQEEIAQVTGLLQSYWTLRSAELRALTGSSLITIPNIDEDPLIRRFAGRISRDKLFELYSARTPISRQEFDALFAAANGPTDARLAKVLGPSIRSLGHSAVDMVYALDSEAAATLPPDKQRYINAIKRQLAIDAFQRLSAEQKTLMQWNSVESLPADSLYEVFALSDIVEPETSLGHSSFIGAAQSHLAQATRRAQQDPQQARSRQELDTLMTAAAAAGPWGKAAQQVWARSPEFLKNFAASMYSRKDKVLPVIGLGLAGLGAALGYLVYKFPLAFLGAGIGMIFGPAAAAFGFGAGMYAHQAIGNISSLASSAISSVGSAAGNAANGVSNFLSSGVNGFKTVFSKIGLTNVIAGGTTGTFLLGTIMTNMTASTFLQPFPTVSGQGTSPYITIVKTSQEGIKFENSELPLTIHYNVTIKADKGYDLVIKSIGDELDVQVNEETRGEVSIAGRSKNLMELVPAEAQSNGVITLASGNEITVSYEETYDSNYADSSITNKVSVSFTAQITEEALAAGQEDLSSPDQDIVASTGLILCVGECPRGELCWPVTGIITQMPFNPAFTHKYADAYDIGANMGNPIYSPFAGTVYEGHISLRDGSTPFGVHVVVESLEGAFLFAHMIRTGESVTSTPQSVSPGDIIGYVGNTGNVQTAGGGGYHLHYELFEADSNGVWQIAQPPSTLQTLVPEPNKGLHDPVQSCYDL